VKILVIRSLYSGPTKREVAAYRHLNQFRAGKPGSKFVRTLLDHFTITGPVSEHECLVHEPLGIKASELQKRFPKQRYPSHILRMFTHYVLSALAFLHESGVVHAGTPYHALKRSLSNSPPDIQANNVLMGVESNDAFVQMEEAEAREPSESKTHQDGRYIVYRSRVMPGIEDLGEPVLTDFGEARIIHGDCSDDIQPEHYRAPEVIFEHPWNEKVDLWNFGCLVRINIRLR
jgi:serine/threonine-protein kinase SRPK3